MRNILLSLLSAFALLMLLPIAQAADADAAKQPSTDRIISHVDMKKALEQPENVTILDVRRNSDYDKDSLTMPMARRFDPDKISEWSSLLPKDKEVVLFCAHGRSISDASVNYLVKNGFKARFVSGGFDGWKDAGGATIAKTK
jgi:rhodanese-related sulfurtransferase